MPSPRSARHFWPTANEVGPRRFYQFAFTIALSGERRPITIPPPWEYVRVPDRCSDQLSNSDRLTSRLYMYVSSLPPNARSGTKRMPARTYAPCVCVCLLCVALAPACGPRCETSRPDFLIGRALVSAEECIANMFADRFPRARFLSSGVSRGLLAC